MKFRARLYLPFMFMLGGLAIGTVWYLGNRGDAGTGTDEPPSPPSGEALSLPSAPMANEQTVNLGNAVQLGALTGGGGPRAVMVGGSAETNACPGTGKVIRREGAGETLLPVRAAPATGAQEIDQLHMDAQVYLCERAGAGGWTGIVYGAGGTLGAGCGVTSPIEQRTAYIGSCRSGWVSSRSVETVAN